VIYGALAAAVTPLRDGGTRLDEDAFGPVADFLAAGGLDGILALGTTGEGILLTVDERRRAAELYLEACRGRLEVAVHCGAQTTAETVTLAEHAASAGASAVAVIPPPYFPLSEESLFEHFRAAAEACAPVPFFLYEFEARSGYAIPQRVIERLRQAAPNLAGLKVSDTPFEHDVQLRVPDVRKAKDVLGYEATTSLETMLDEVIPWIRDEVEAGRL